MRMSPIWAVLLVLVAFTLVLRLKGRKKRKLKVPVYSRRIEGLQVVAQLEPDMSSGCLFDHGIQFGKGFRRKEGPKLPHPGNCRCKTVPFSFNSNEVFNGALRSFAAIGTNHAELPAKIADQLAESMKAAESPKVPKTLEGYLEAVNLEKVEASAGAEVQKFLTARFEFLRGGWRSHNSPQPIEAGDADEAESD